MREYLEGRSVCLKDQKKKGHAGMEKGDDLLAR